jgi:ABC-type lipoprotein release transport system permease subunit
MILRLVLASLRRRFRQLALILAAVTVAAATVATLAGFSSRAEHRLGESLAAFGPNLTVRPQVGGPARLSAAALERVRSVPGVQSASYSPGLEPGLDRIEARADPNRLEAVARGIESRVEGVEAVALRRVSQSDASLTRRLTLVLAAVSAVSFLLALLSVGTATTALVGERRVEIGLMLALGYTGRRVGTFLAVELLAAAVLAGAVGEILGELAAGGLARRMLGTGGGISMTWGGFAASALAAVLVVGSSMLVALRRVERLDAARVLRGE